MSLAIDFLILPNRCSHFHREAAKVAQRESGKKYFLPWRIWRSLLGRHPMVMKWRKWL